MEFIAGESLAQRIAQGRVLDPARALDLLLELLGVLEYLHGRVPPVLHRDIKPGNVILRENGPPALVDFGAVRTTHHAPHEGGSTVVGTYGYMPYEQYMGQAGPASDLYALGATMLHVLTGRHPSQFMADDNRIAVPRDLPGGEPLRSVVARLLEPAPARRFPSARAARDALLGAGTALVPADAHVPAPLALTPAPRALEGEAAGRFRQVAHSAWRLMDPTTPPDEGWGFTDLITVIFFSAITAGVLPLVFISLARSRRRRLRTFFERGTPGVARITEFKSEDIAFDVKLTRVLYEFEADGGTHRGSDLALPVIADRWRAGDMIEVLFLPERNYDSVIASAR